MSSTITLSTPIIMRTLEKMNEEALYKTINDERTYSETFYTTYTGSIIPRITGPISAVSSALIIFIILRSNVKLTTIYHRLIFGMSIADVISSIAMACSTVPMPKDMVYKQIQGTVLGNIQTCEAQGFIMTYGLCISFSYNFVLCTYYLCSINWKMTEATIRKRVEPFFHFVAIIISLGPALISLLANNINPTPYNSWCGISPYPYYCFHSTPEDDCLIRGNHAAASIAIHLYTLVFIIGYSIVLLSMVMIVRYVYNQQRLLKISLLHDADPTYTTSAERIHYPNMVIKRLRSCKTRHQYTKAVLIQALAYVGALLICQNTFFINMVYLFISSQRTNSLFKSRSLQIVGLCTLPLQGFFNLVIFVCSKAYNIHMTKPSQSFKKSLSEVFLTKKEPIFIFSSISVVQVHAGQGEQQIIEFDYGEQEGKDEGEEEDAISEEDQSHDKDLHNYHQSNLHNHLESFEDNSAGLSYDESKMRQPSVLLSRSSVSQFDCSDHSDDKLSSAMSRKSLFPQSFLGEGFSDRQSQSSNSDSNWGSA